MRLSSSRSDGRCESCGKDFYNMNGTVIHPGAEKNPDSQNMRSAEGHPVLPDYAQLNDRIPMGARDLALTIVATIAVVFSLQWAEKFFIPLLLGIIIAYTLNPL